MIVITGATGLVGSHLLLELMQQNQKVLAIYQNIKSIDKTKMVFEQNNKIILFESINWFEASVLNVNRLMKAFENAHFVYHCAAKVSFNPADEEVLRKTNIEGTANVVNCCLALKIDKLCFVSSIAALGDLLPNQTLYTEETEWNPEKNHSDYALSKYGAETEVWRGFYEGLNMVIVNPGVIIPPLYWQEGSGEVAKKVKNIFWFYTHGVTGFVPLPNVINCVIKVMQSEITGERFILVSENLSYFELLKIYAEKLKVKPPKFYFNKFLSSLVWKIDWFLSLLSFERNFSKSMMQSLHSKDFYSNQKIVNTLDFKFETIKGYISRL